MFEENDTSASKGRRPIFAEMMRRLHAGEATALIAWSLDRLTRRPREIEDVLDLAQDRGVALATCSGEIDLGTAQGRSMARISATFARQEVEVKSERQRAANAQRAEAGRPHVGRRPFGYAADCVNIVEAEAVQIRWAVDFLLAGGSLRGVATELTRRDVTTTAGGPWRPTELRRMLANPRYAGLRTHRGQVIGPAAWEGIISEEAHVAIKAVFSDPSRRRPGRPRRYLLSGLARCGVCRARCYGATDKRGPLYFCETRQHVARRGEQVDELVRESVIARLSLADAVDAVAPAKSDNQAARLRKEERRLRSLLDGLAEAFAAGDIDADQLRAGSRRLREQRESVAAELSRLARRPALTALLSTADVRTMWEELHIDTQREVLDELMTITLQPPGRGARVFEPRTVEITWKA